jgi:hypothetical protein
MVKRLPWRVGKQIYSISFSVVFIHRRPHIPAPRQTSAKQLLNIEILEQDVFQLLKTTKIDKSPGLDGKHPRVFKECTAELAGPLTTLFRKTLQKGKIPVDWRETSVMLIYKKGKRTDASNYHPISVTSNVSKIM